MLLVVDEMARKVERRDQAPQERRHEGKFPGACVRGAFTHGLQVLRYYQTFQHMLS